MEDSTEKWKSVITSLRSLFSGKILYRTNYWVTANWAPETIVAYNKKLNNPLFGLVDIIAIATYFELTDNRNPSVDQLIDAIYSVPLYGRGQNIFKEIKAFYDKWNKPIFFGELGIPPYSNSPEQPHNAFGDLGNTMKQFRRIGLKHGLEFFKLKIGGKDILYTQFQMRSLCTT